MPRVLVTAFEPYDSWSENASWMALVELTRELPTDLEIVTRRYPVDYALVRERLERDLAAGFDFAVFLGQAPGSTVIQLEAIGINAADGPDQSIECQPIVPDGPVAYRSALPLGAWAGRLRDAGIPARLSHHAGTYLCNATLYLSHYLCERHAWATRSVFVHVPLAPSQAARHNKPLASLPSSVVASAVRLILQEMALPRAIA